MRKTIILYLISLFLVLMGSTAAAEESQMIRAGILRDTGEVTITAYDGFDVVDLQSGEIIQEAVDSIKLQAGFMGVQMEDGQSYYQIGMIPKESAGLRLNYLEAGGKPYRGTLEVRRSAAGKLTVINELPVEDYVRGVVSKEMPASFEPEALKAQAVIARNYVLSNLNKHGSEGFDVCAGTHCQVYGGVSAETTATNRVVDETLGEVLTYNGRLVNAVFHASSGGHTENNENVWFTKTTAWAEPYLRGVPDFDQDCKYASWEKSYSKTEITGMLKGKGVDIGEFQGIDITEAGVSGRVKWATLIGSNGKKEITGEQFRSYFGLLSQNAEVTGGKAEEQTVTEETIGAGQINIGTNTAILGAQGKRINVSLRDKYVVGANGTPRKITTANIFAYPFHIITEKTVTVIQNDSDTVTFKGKGYGHGVGLSQWGAQGMAKLGYNYEEILKHYYTGVKLEER